MWEVEILGVSIYYITGLLIVFSFIGWVWESSYVSVCEKRLANRGYVMGPLCTIYGVAVAVAYIVLRPLRGQYILLFLAGTIFATVLELVTFKVMDTVFHTSWWDYTDKKFNYKGMVCLEASVLWGLCAELLFTVMIPFFDWFTSLYPKRTGEAVYTVIFFLYLIDFTIATIAAADISKQIAKLEAMLDEIGAALKNSRIYSTSEEVVSKLLQLKTNLVEADYLRRYSKRLEVMQAVWADQFKFLGIKETMTDLRGKLKTAAGKFEESWAGAKFKVAESRVFKAYPKLKSKKKLTDILNSKEDD
ncbi:MAG TPA: hypothetical protein DCW47_04050 [Lachnospiraceae bacterium]|nr:hypothetical protein [Lachnospiraceae bacterium]